jgi:hypothetical protein
MSILSDFKNSLENMSPLNVYLEYDNTALELRPESFVTVGIDSEECSYDIQNDTQNFSKDKIAFRVRVIMHSDTNANIVSNYFDTYILNAIMKSNEFNVLSVKKGTPNYTKYIDRMESDNTILVECINTFE